MRFLALLSLLTLAACDELADFKTADTDLETKMRDPVEGETLVTIYGTSDGDVVAITQDYGGEPVPVVYGVAYADQTFTIAGDDYAAVGQIYWRVRDESTGWEVSTDTDPSPWPVEQQSLSLMDGATGQGWRSIGPVGLTIDMSPSPS